ncbi:hypothetical protein GCM10010123_19850 [Pilimelia anulata]|uniref:Uncharacterized protein n=1 Tax=Pilimelia anulata TaxID=53371 RepID=A0A8J3F9X8_9ACTN|nr:conjugal transfer protein TrbL family protein [Pilimelia anulata]GGJ90043.1 hypothetical protein GCM10010123_19850 [Pilimelia anulata]
MLGPTAVAYLLNGILEWLAERLVVAFDTIVGILTKVLLVIPDVTALPQIKALTGRSVWVVDTIFVLVFLAAGVLVMCAGGSERARYEAKDLAPRMVVGFIAAHFSPLICSMAINLANALTFAFADRPGTESAVAAMRRHLRGALSGDQAAALLLVLIGVLVVVLAGIAVFQALARLCALLVLAAFAPIALAMHALPQTDPLAKLWWRGFGGCLAVPVLQAFVLQAAMWMLTDPQVLLPHLGLPGDGAAVVNLLIVVVLLWATVKIPRQVARLVRSPSAGGRTVVGAIVRVAVTRAIPIPGLKGR